MLSTMHAPELVTSDEYAGIANSQIESISTADANDDDGESTMENELQFLQKRIRKSDSALKTLSSTSDNNNNNVAANVSSWK